MVPLPICPESAVARHKAEAVSILCNRIFKQRFGYENRLMPKYSQTSVPILCVAVEVGFWQLYCNEPEMTSADLIGVRDELREGMKAL
jgi:hypothetical protein